MRPRAGSYSGVEPDDPPTSPGTLAAQTAIVVQAVRQEGERTRESLNLHDRLTRVEHKTEIETMQREAAIERHNERLKKLEDEVEDTGEHSKKALEEEIKRLQGSQSHWVRWAIATAIGFVIALLLFTLGKLIH